MESADEENLPARHKPIHKLRCSLKHHKDSDLHLDYLHRHMAGGDIIGMKKNLFIVLGAVLLLAVGLFLASQFGAGRQVKVYKVGIVALGKTYLPGIDGFKEKMRGLGYEEGKNVVYYTHSVDKREDLPAIIAETLSQKIDLLHVYGTPTTVEAYKQTKDVPIVFGSMGDPLASKTIQSLEKPGTNVTGVNSLSAPLIAKRLEFLLEAMPSIRRVAIPFGSGSIPGVSSYGFAIEAAKKLEVELVPYYISKERPIKETASAIKRSDVDGIIISSDTDVWANLASYVEQAIKEKLPFAVFDKDMVVSGGLLGYGPDYFATGEQSAVLVDKILHGASPSDLPIEVPQKLILVVNLKTAKAIGLAMPQDFLKKADLILGD